MEELLLVTGLLLAGVVVEVLRRSRRRVLDRLRVLEHAQYRLTRITETAPGVIYAFRLRPDGTTCFPYASPNIVGLFGVHPDQLALDGSPAFALMPPEDAARIQATIARSAQTLAPWRDEFRIRGADGQERWLEGNSLPQREPDGSVLWHGFIAEVTERKRTGEALRESEQRFRQLAESIREAFWLYDCATERLVYVSPAYETIWGVSRDCLNQHPSAWLDAIHEGDRARVRRAAERQAAGDYDERYRVVRPDGTVRWVHDRAFPVRDGSGRVIRVAGVAEDITDRLHLENQFRQTQKLESVGQLAGGVAHDFNNLLTVITGTADLLAADLPPGDPSRELVQEIQHAGRRGATLTRQLLAFSRQEVVEPRVLELGTVIADTEKMLRRLIGEDVLLTTTVHQPVFPVRIDPGQWTQVLVNLSVNARDAMPRGGKLTITVHAADLDAARTRRHPGLAPGKYAVLTLADTGCGMTPDVLSQIFEPFYTTKGVGHGTGLGLAVVYGIVEQSGGHIEVESTPGAGTTFTIWLPAASGEPVAVLDQSPGAVPGGRETILLVEDDEGLRRVAARMLETRGYKVKVAADGLEALGMLARNGRAHLILTDVVMPNMGGAELAQAVRAQYPDTRILFASGYLDDAVVRAGIQTAEVAFLQKPYSAAELLRRVREVLDGKPTGHRSGTRS